MREKQEKYKETGGREVQSRENDKRTGRISRKIRRKRSRSKRYRRRGRCATEWNLWK